MSYYLVAELNFKDEAWWPEYLTGNSPLIEKHGGEVLARTRQFDMLSPGDPPSVMVIIKWPTKEAAQAFATDPDYAPYEKMRVENSTGRAFLVLDEDEVNTL